ncbi:MAG: hypothetical protein WC770_04535 [Phycisphaerae bacterium]|jgi:hypothetical protein
MNQIELNRIAMNYIEMQSIELASKIDLILTDDLLKKMKEHNGPTIHHIHNLAIYNSLAKLNSLFQVNSNSEKSLSEYCELAESLKPKFMEIVETLKDFQPSGETSNNE